MYDDIWYGLIIIVKPSKNLLQNFIRYQLHDNYARIALLVWVWQKFWTMQSFLWIWALLLSTGLEWKRMWWKNGRSRPSRLCVQICWSQQVKKGQERKMDKSWSECTIHSQLVSTSTKVLIRRQLTEYWRNYHRTGGPFKESLSQVLCKAFAYSWFLCLYHF